MSRRVIESCWQVHDIKILYTYLRRNKTAKRRPTLFVESTLFFYYILFLRRVSESSAVVERRMNKSTDKSYYCAAVPWGIVKNIPRSPAAASAVRRHRSSSYIYFFTPVFSLYHSKRTGRKGTVGWGVDREEKKRKKHGIQRKKHYCQSLMFIYPRV